MSADDPHNLYRFKLAQGSGEDSTYARALAELRTGKKQFHWMWFIFPQFAGLGHSEMARHYAIGSVAEAWAYMADRMLGPRLLECVEALLALEEDDPYEIMGGIDGLKLHSSLTLFAQSAPEPELFDEALAKLYGGQLDQNTIELIDPGDDPYEPYG